MATVLFLNNYQTTLGAALSSTATTMTVSSTTGLPSSLASGQFIPMTLTPASNPGSAYEIVYVTGISGSSLTVTRGEEGTSALNWNTGDILYSTNTAQTTGTSMGSPSTDFQTNTLTASGLITANDGINVAGGTITIPNATASKQPVALGQFPSSLTGAGYKKYPDPNSPSGFFIEQWNVYNIAANSNTQVNYPIAFPNGFLGAMISYNNGAPATQSPGFSGQSTASIYLVNTSSGPVAISLFVKGY